MLVSIVIPIYNVSQYIERCLISALDQTYTEIEYILIDDCSPDDSMEKARNVIEQYDNKRSINIISHDRNRGLSAARNTGVNAAKGDYIYFLDSDDELLPVSIERLILIAKKHSPDFIISEFELIGSSDRKKYPTIKFKDKEVVYGKEIPEGLYKRIWHGMAWNKLLRKDLFFEKKCFFYDGIIHEDILWSFILANKSTKMAVCKEATYLYRIRHDSITQKFSQKNFQSLLIIFKEIHQYFSNFIAIESNTNLFDYIVNLKIYFLKELIKSTVDKSIIKDHVNRINSIFPVSIVPNITYYSIESLLRAFFLNLPISIIILCVKIILFIERKK
jgi:glycosyltransferase involved in cell wall biosynthesis